MINLKTTTALVGIGILSFSGMAKASDPWATWNTQNNFGVVTDGTNTTITTSAAVAGGNSPDLDIEFGESVNVNQINSSALFYGRAADDADPTQILGNLNSNGRLLIIDRNGVFFGPNSITDVAGIVATTGDISDADIFDNDQFMTIDNFDETGNIDVQGDISLNQVGVAAFVSPFVRNSGTINAQLGSVAIAAAETVTLDFYGDGLVSIAATTELQDALIENVGSINATDGGEVRITALAAKNAVDNVINMEGIVSASSASVEGGKIVLDGGESGTVRLAGELNVSGDPSGGSIEVSGENITALKTSDFDLDGGDLTMAALDNITLSKGINSQGGDMDFASNDFVMKNKISLDAKGGSITIDNNGVFNTDRSNSLRTKGTGTITVNQNKSNGGIASQSIQKVVNAIRNTGTGLNTINVGAGTWNEAINANVHNLTLNGNNQGVAGFGPRNAETLVRSNSWGVIVNARDVTIDGFSFAGDTLDYGVLICDLTNTVVQNNIINDASFAGVAGIIDQENSPTQTSINNNLITGADTGDGVFLVGDSGIVNQLTLKPDFSLVGTNIDISNNVIGGDDGIRGDGVSIGRIGDLDGDIADRFPSLDLETVINISGNTITNAQNGVTFLRSIEGSDITVDGNILNIRENGVNFQGDIAGETQVSVSGNTITAGDNGINIAGDMLNILTTGANRDEFIFDNNAIKAQNNGILIPGLSNGANQNMVISNSSITAVSGAGVLHSGGIFGSELRIENNQLIQGKQNGVRIVGPMPFDNDQAARVRITNNVEINGTRRHGINISDSASDGAIIDIIGNDVSNNGENGIYISARAAELTIDNNVLFNNGENGALVRARAQSGSSNLNDFNSTITNNAFESNAERGLYIKDVGHDNVVLAGNQFIDNLIGVEFQSGVIDVTNVDNPNSFTLTESFDIGSNEEVVGMLFNQSSENPLNLTILDETLGTTIFDGYGDFDVGVGYYVYFEDGNILDPSLTDPVIEIDATNVDFDGVIASDFVGNEVPVNLLNAIEARLNDADDVAVNGRGQIFAGLPLFPVIESEAGIDNVEDFFNDFVTFFENQSGLNVIITGVPGTTVPQGNILTLANQTNTAALAAIETAAGENTEDRGLVTTTQAELADLDPDAGTGSDAVCWGDTIESAQSGRVTSLTWNGTPEENFVSLIRCQTETF